MCVGSCVSMRLLLGCAYTHKQLDFRVRNKMGSIEWGITNIALFE